MPALTRLMRLMRLERFPMDRVRPRRGGVAAPAPEQHYLQFDGATDFAYADAGATGIESGVDGWTQVIKVADRTVTAGTKVYTTVYDAVGNFPRQSPSYIYGGAASVIKAEGLHSVSGLLYTGACADATLNGEQVFALTHKNTVTRRWDLWLVQNGATLETAGGTFSQQEARSPLHYGIGAYLTKQSGSHATAGNILAVRLIAFCLVRGAVTEAELQAYSLTRDARTVWDASRLWAYHAASQVSGSSIPNLGSSSVPLTLSGPVAGDLVALPAAVTSYYSSPGGAGDYAEASTNVAARVVFPAASVPVASVSFWAQNATQPMVLGDLGDLAPSISFASAGECDVDVSDVAGSLGLTFCLADPGTAPWHHFVATMDGTSLIIYGDGVADDAGLNISAGAFAAADALRALSAGTAGDIRSIMLIDRALTAGEVAALYAAGETHNPLAGTGAWAGGQSIPVLWCTAAVAGVVANSGDGGVCNLVLNGAVASLVDP